MRNPLMILLVLLCAAGTLKAREQPLQGVVLVISDGTSIELLSTARVYAHGATGSLAIDAMPQTALVKTYSASHMVTDSAAAATSMARGVKTQNGAVGMIKGGGEELPSILDIARRQGWATAVVCDDDVVGATPGAFIVEQDHRGAYQEIAAKIVEQMGREKRLDLLLGGGRKFFPELAEGEQEKIVFFGEWEEFAGRELTLEKPVMGLFKEGTFPYLAQEPERRPRLVEMTREALRLLQADGRPFLLIVEAALADKASHGNLARAALEEVLEYDAVIGLLQEQLDERSHLVLATTDHGTGGFALNGYLPLAASGEALLRPHPVTGRHIISWGSGPGAASEDLPPQEDVPPESPRFRHPAAIPAKSSLHTGGDVFLFGRGPGSEQVRGVIENTRIFEIMRDAIEGAKQKE